MAGGHGTPAKAVITMQQLACRRFWFGLILAPWVLSGCASRQEAASSVSTQAPEIRIVLDAQVEAWNRGSIREFMEGYAMTDTLRFASGGTVFRGWDRTLRRYQESYSDTAMMGTLSFSDLEIWMLGEKNALVFGKWKLRRSDLFTDIGGLFTLLFDQRPEGWRIVHDHTSAAIDPEQAASTQAE
jgi:ketosteroid isomerase-like protein